MTTLTILNTQEKITDKKLIKKMLDTHGVYYAQWKASQPLSINDSQETILKAYEHELGPYMKKHGFQSADVINVHPGTPNLEAIRGKFLKEHTHSEDEVRFFVDGEGLFFFNFEDEGKVVSLHLEKGDFISVPKGYKHWFDLAPKYFVKAIRVFSNMEGWVANYTNSGIDEKYNQL